MRDLHGAIAERVAAWREAGYRHEEYPAIAEVLHYAHDDPSGSLRYLRAAQFRALETWQAIASLPHLGVFSDEAHHTYGRSLGSDLKRVRQTVDDLARATTVVAVINTTGTPYFERQPIRDVVVWYGLRQGIADAVLKDVAGNIQSFAFRPEEADTLPASRRRSCCGTPPGRTRPRSTPSTGSMTPTHPTA